MKKTLAQKTFFSGESAGNMQDYYTLYTVPTPANPDSYSDKIYSDIVIYIHPTLTSDKEEISMNFNIRIVKSEDPTNPMPVGVGGDAATTDDGNDIYGKGLLIHRPTRDRKDYPIKLDGISMETGDKIVVQSLTSGITVQVFGEELQYDSDCYFRMHRDMMTLQRQQDLAESNETQDILTAWADKSHLDLVGGSAKSIAKAIEDHQTQYTCNCG